MELIKDDITLLLGRDKEGVTAKVTYVKQFLECEVASALFGHLESKLPCEQQVGKFGPEPWLTCWFGRPYSYSGILLKENRNWEPTLKSMLEEVTKVVSPVLLNSVFCNLYRDGNNSNGWHADDVIELGKHATIVSISLGAPRVFELRNKMNKNIVARFLLEKGSLLIMDGPCQELYHHWVPLACEGGAHIDLTFRHIVDTHHPKMLVDACLSFVKGEEFSLSPTGLTIEIFLAGIAMFVCHFRLKPSLQKRIAFLYESLAMCMLILAKSRNLDVLVIKSRLLDIA